MPEKLSKQINELGLEWRKQAAENLHIYAQKWVLNHPEATKREVFDEILKASFWGADISMTNTAEAKALSASFSFMAEVHQKKKTLVEDESFSRACNESAEFQELMYQVKFQIASVRSLALQLPIFTVDRGEVVEERILYLTAFAGGNQTIVVKPFQ